MTRSVLVIMAQEGKSRTNVISDDQSQGLNRWSAVQGDVPRSSFGMGKYCRNKG